MGGGEKLSSAPSRHRFPWLRGLGMALGMLVFLLAVTWPVAAPLLTLGLAGYALWLWRAPQAWLLVVPALAPVLDLTPYTGQVFFNEWDLLVLTTLAVGWQRGSSAVEKGFLLPRPVLWALALYIGSFTTYLSPWHGLRVAKGLAWALLLASLLGRFGLPVRQELERWWVPGMAIGLIGGVGAVLWERATYPGFLDFTPAPIERRRCFPTCIWGDPPSRPSRC